MTTFSKILVICPHCKCIMYEYELMSYTIHKATYFSDGKNESDSFVLPGHRIGICHNCKLPFWKEDARCELDAYDEKYSNVPEVKDLFDLESLSAENYHVGKIEFFQEIIDNGFSNTVDRTIYLREQLWWAINDLVRNSIKPCQLFKFRKLSFGQWKNLAQSRRQSQKEFKKFNPLFLDNLSKLAILLLKNSNEDQLFLAEVYREQGKFRLANSTLKSLAEKSGKTYRQIRNAIRWRKSGVFEIS